MHTIDNFISYLRGVISALDGRPPNSKQWSFILKELDKITEGKKPESNLSKYLKDIKDIQPNPVSPMPVIYPGKDLPNQWPAPSKTMPFQPGDWPGGVEITCSANLHSDNVNTLGDKIERQAFDKAFKAKFVDDSAPKIKRGLIKVGSFKGTVVPGC